MKKEVLYILIVVIVAGAFILVKAGEIGYKEYLRRENLKIEEQQKRLLNDCLKDAETSYYDLWDSNCKLLGKKEDCGLPLYLATDIEKNREQDEKLCMDKYKNKAFIKEKSVVEKFLEDK